MMQPTSTLSRQITNQTIGDIIPNTPGICPRIVDSFAWNSRQPMQASEIVDRDESSGRQGD
jgi:hypothetical protein